MCKNRAVLFFIILLCNLVYAQAYKKEFVPYSKYLDKNTLYVVAGFDGSYNAKRWDEILSFARGTGVKFSFFISGVYLIPNVEKNTYIYPTDPTKTGISGIGFGGTKDEVLVRKNWIRKALDEGHDIQSHLNCHIPGDDWSQAAWAREIEQFDKITADIPVIAKHIRFPNLVHNENVYLAMAQYGYRTIIGVVQPNWNGFNRITLEYNGEPYTIIEFPIPRNGKGLLMDWNTNEYDKKHNVSSLQAEEYVYSAYMKEAALCIEDNRPLFLSHHFTWYNNGAHWRAMKRALKDLKKYYKVEFVTINELYLLLTPKR